MSIDCLPIKSRTWLARDVSDTFTTAVRLLCIPFLLIGTAVLCHFGSPLTRKICFYRKWEAEADNRHGRT